MAIQIIQIKLEDASDLDSFVPSIYKMNVPILNKHCMGAGESLEMGSGVCRKSQQLGFYHWQQSRLAI